MIKEKYEIDLSTRQFDNVIDATNAAWVISEQNDYIAIKVYRSVLYTGASEWKKTTLTIVQASKSYNEFQSREKPTGCTTCR
jgi:NADH:ubiquinone oxidoreductase subunit F (NADH-binding)